MSHTCDTRGISTRRPYILLSKDNQANYSKMSAQMVLRNRWAKGPQDTLQHTAAHCNALQHRGVCATDGPTDLNILGNTLQHTATHCNTEGYAQQMGKRTSGWLSPARSLACEGVVVIPILDSPKSIQWHRHHTSEMRHTGNKKHNRR